MHDKPPVALLDALRLALTEQGVHRLYKTGKLPGLFAAKPAIHADAAAQALRDGLLEVVHTETKGKATIDWVRVTPAGVRLLHEHESPLKALEELHATLQTAHDGVPAWLADMRERLQALERQLTDNAQRFLNQLDALTRRVDEALHRLHAAAPQLPDGVADAVPWASAALTYLDQRTAGGATQPCPLPELFTALAPSHPDLSVTDFHTGLRHLRDWHALRLLPFDNPGELPQPEFALLEGDSMLYYAAR